MSKKKKIVILWIMMIAMVTTVTMIGISKASQQSNNSTLYLRYLMVLPGWDTTETNTNKIKRVENVINEVKEKAEVYVEPPMRYGRGEDSLLISISKDGETHYYLVAHDHIRELKEEYSPGKTLEGYWIYSTDDEAYKKIKKILKVKYKTRNLTKGM